MLENPFIYGEVAAGDFFTNRAAELSGLINDLSGPCRIFLISPRRYGKTSLALSALAALKKRNLLTAHLDMYQAASLEQFAALYAKAVARATQTKLDDAVAFIRSMLQTLRPKIEIDPQGDISISLDAAPSQKETFQVLKQALDSPEKIAQKTGKRFVVFLDEFQEIQTIGGQGLEKFIRAVVQHHHRVSYLFAGSKQSVLMDMVNKKSRAFYKMGKVQFLGKIPCSEFAEFIVRRFSQTGFTLEEDVAELILDAADGVPCHVQHLCHEIWNECRGQKNITKSRIPQIISKIVAAQSPIYVAMWDALSLPQRRLLQTIARLDGKNIFSREFIRRGNLGASSSVQISAKLLIQKDILQKENGEHFFADPWFKEWVRRLQ